MIELVEEKKNNELSCSCVEAVKRFIVSTTFKNYSFKIEGSMFETKKIHITYFGKLTNKKINKKNIVYLYYSFDNKWDEKNIIELDICKKYNNSFCTNIYLEHQGMLYLAFTDGFGNWDTDKNSVYSFKIYPDKEKEIIKRYNLEPTVLNIKNKKSSLILFHHFTYLRFKKYFNLFIYFLKTKVFN